MKVMVNETPMYLFRSIIIYMYIYNNLPEDINNFLSFLRHQALFFMQER